MDNKNDNCKKSVKYNMPENIETEEVIDYSVNCYYINNEKQQNNNDSIINYQTYCGNVCNTEKNVENDDEIIEFSNFNDITPNKDYKDNNQNNNKYDKKDFEQDPDFKSELNGDDDIVEYNAQDDPDLMNDNNYLNNNINNNNNINLNNNNNNESSDDYSSYDDDDDSRSFAENVGSQIYGGDGILLGSSDGGESINPDEMTYEQLLELQEKIGFVNKGFSESMIGKIPDETFCSGVYDKCVICQYEFVEKDMIKKLKCKHIFHSKCATIWLGKEKKCPICNEEVNLKK